MILLFIYVGKGLLGLLCLLDLPICFENVGRGLLGLLCFLAVIHWSAFSILRAIQYLGGFLMLNSLVSCNVSVLQLYYF